MILGNARAETLLMKPAFRDAAQHRRGLVPADGFYEWEKAGRARLPHYFYLKERQPFFFAGIWQPESDVTPAAFAIITTAPNALVQPIHDRMPVILGPNSGRAWLGNQPLPPDRLSQLCRPLPAEMMTSHRVDPRMNSSRHESPDCVAPLDSG
jgi:putative SOS response-associated peptidase YedK